MINRKKLAQHYKTENEQYMLYMMMKLQAIKDKSVSMYPMMTVRSLLMIFIFIFCLICVFFYFCIIRIKKKKENKGGNDFLFVRKKRKTLCLTIMGFNFKAKKFWAW